MKRRSPISLILLAIVAAPRLKAGHAGNKGHQASQENRDGKHSFQKYEKFSEKMGKPPSSCYDKNKSDQYGCHDLAPFILLKAIGNVSATDVASTESPPFFAAMSP